jgi:HEAT repeat protein
MTMQRYVLPTRAAVILASTALLLLTSDSARAQLPEVVTREWLKSEFLNFIEGPPPSAGEKWVSVRGRPETLSLLIKLYEDRKENTLVRHNALLRIGNTGQIQAYEYLARLWDRMPGRADDRDLVAYSLGSWPPDREPPALATQKLREILNNPDPSVRIIAVHGLSNNTPAARLILQERLGSETHTYVRNALENAINRFPK